LIADSGGKGLYAVDGTSNAVMGSMVNPPDAWASDYYFYAEEQSGWGLNCQGYFQGTKWGDTDGFAWRHTNGGNACLVDGHAKFFRVSGGLAIGTNYQPTQSCTSVQVTDYSLYHWDPRFTSGAQQ
jgi:prepilin-type processing-associated H-X9-DG protein